MKNKNYTTGTSYQLYIKSINNFPLLSKSEEKSLFLSFFNGHDFAREILINSNLKLVVSIAKSHLSSNDNLQDLIQEGTIGLIHAINKFNPTLDLRLSTYATQWIKHYISNYQYQRTIRLPQNVIVTFNRITFFSSHYTKTYGKSPTLETLSNHLKISPKKLRSTLSNIEYSSIIKSQDSISEDTFSPSHHTNPIFSPEKHFEIKENKLLLKTLLKTLSPREIFIFQERYGLNGDKEKSFRKISVTLNLTKEAVRQIYLKAMKKLMILVQKNNLKAYSP